MKTNGLECNIEEVFNKFCDLSSSEMTKAVRRAINKGAKTLQEETKTKLSSKIKTRNNPHWYDGKRVEFNDKIDDGVRRTKVYENGNDDLEAKVHILGVRSSGSGTYRLRFLEKGTTDRYQKSKKNVKFNKPKYTGRIAGRYFFREAQQSVLPRLSNIYMAEIQKTIEKINNTDL